MNPELVVPTIDQRERIPERNVDMLLIMIKKLKETRRVIQICQKTGLKG